MRWSFLTAATEDVMACVWPWMIVLQPVCSRRLMMATGATRRERQRTGRPSLLRANRATTKSRLEGPSRATGFGSFCGELYFSNCSTTSNPRRTTHKSDAKGHELPRGSVNIMIELPSGEVLIIIHAPAVTRVAEDQRGRVIRGAVGDNVVEDAQSSILLVQILEIVFSEMRHLHLGQAEKIYKTQGQELSDYRGHDGRRAVNRSGF